MVFGITKLTGGQAAMLCCVEIHEKTLKKEIKQLTTITDVTYAKAWNSKWHIHAFDNGIAPAEPIGPYNNVEKPARHKAITLCGLSIFVKRYDDKFPQPITPHNIGNWCEHCYTIAKRLNNYG